MLNRHLSEFGKDNAFRIPIEKLNELNSVLSNFHAAFKSVFAPQPPLPTHTVLLPAPVAQASQTQTKTDKTLRK